MAYKPRILVEVLKDGVQQSPPIYIPVFQMSIDNQIGIVSDWFTLQILNTDHKYDWLFDNMERHEIKIYSGLVDSSISSKNVDELAKKLKDYCILWGFIGPTSKTIGTQVSNLISIKGGDACYVLNKKNVGDRWEEELSAVNANFLHYKSASYKKVHSTTKSSPAKTMPFGILRMIMNLDQSGKALDNNCNGIGIIASEEFKNISDLSGMVQPEKFKGALTEEDISKTINKLYQTQNNTILEIIDDICTKTGYDATTMPGTKDVIIYKDMEEYDKLIDKYGKSLRKEELILYCGDESKNAPSDIYKLMYLKMDKYPGYEDGINFTMRHGDWTGIAKNTAIKKSNTKYNIQATAYFSGNKEKDAIIEVNKIYDPISRQAMVKKTLRAMDRMICNRIQGYAGMIGRIQDVMPGTRFRLRGAGFFSGDNKEHAYLANLIYLITSIKTNYSNRGYTVGITFRLKDLEPTSNINEIKEEGKKYTCVYVDKEYK